MKRAIVDLTVRSDAFDSALDMVDLAQEFAGAIEEICHKKGIGVGTHANLRVLSPKKLDASIIRSRTIIVEPRA